MNLSTKATTWLSLTRKVAASTLIGFGALLAMQAASAAVVIDIDTRVTGSPAPDVTVARLTLTQNGANVDAVLENLIGNLGVLATNAFITELEFSYDGNPVITSGAFGNFGGTQVITQSDVTVNPPGQNAGYNFFLNIDYPTSNNADRFVNGEISTWKISGVTEADFQQLVSGEGPDALALVHIQGLTGGGSVKYVGDGENQVPEPATAALLGLGMLCFAGARRRKHS